MDTSYSKVVAFVPVFYTNWGLCVWHQSNWIWMAFVCSRAMHAAKPSKLPRNSPRNRTQVTTRPPNIHEMYRSMEAIGDCCCQEHLHECQEISSLMRTLHGSHYQCHLLLLLVFLLLWLIGVQYKNVLCFLARHAYNENIRQVAVQLDFNSLIGISII